jgi:DNA polymerase theta
MSGFQTSGFQTSVDIARKQPYVVAPLAGQKRPPSRHVDNGNTKYQAPQTIDENDANKSDPTNAQRLGFIRPQVALPKSRLIASEIRFAAGADKSTRSRTDSLLPDAAQGTLPTLNDPKFGLPSSLVANFAAAGVCNIYPWQASCLLGQGLLEGKRHLIYTAPTGGGKSLVADVLMLKRIIENPSCKAILVLPYVALVQEKLKWLRRIVQDVEKHQDQEISHNDGGDCRWKRVQRTIRVSGFFGGSKTTASWADTDIAVCTIEKVRTLQPKFGPPSNELGEFVDQHRY